MPFFPTFSLYSKKYLRTASWVDKKNLISLMPSIRLETGINMAGTLALRHITGIIERNHLTL